MPTLKVVTYNIDGLNRFELSERTTKIIGLVISEEPDIIHFQEVVPETGHLLYHSLNINNYVMCSGMPTTNFMELGRYFTLTFVKDSLAPMTSRISFVGEASSHQGRDLLQTVILYQGVRIMSLNCHLESSGAAFKSVESFIRQAQLSQAMRLLVNHDGPAFIAGDLNIRDSEATKVLKVFSGRNSAFRDVAEVLEGGPKKCSNTWFMTFINGDKARCRFDRIYSNSKCGFRPATIKQIGDEEMFPREELFIGGCTYTTPSDHRGIVVMFDSGTETTPVTNNSGSFVDKSTDQCDDNLSINMQTSVSVQQSVDSSLDVKTANSQGIWRRSTPIPDAAPSNSNKSSGFKPSSSAGRRSGGRWVSDHVKQHSAEHYSGQGAAAAAAAYGGATSDSVSDWKL